MNKKQEAALEKSCLVIKEAFDRKGAAETLAEGRQALAARDFAHARMTFWTVIKFFESTQEAKEALAELMKLDAD